MEMVQVTLLRRTLAFSPKSNVLLAINKSIQAIELPGQIPAVLSCVMPVMNGCVFQNFDLSSPENGEETSTDAASS